MSVRLASVALDRSSAVPLWSQLHDELRRRLAAGDLGAGFPTEQELCRTYGVSRNTVREAMRRLRADGSVVAGRGRRPRLGSTILQPVGSFSSLYESVRAAGLEQRSVVRHLGLCADPGVARRLGLGPESELLRLERLRLAAGEPLADEQIFVPAERTRALLDCDFTTASFYEELSRACAIRLSGGEEQVFAVQPSAAQRRRLAMPAGVAAFSIERFGMVDARPFEWRETLVRADRFSLVAAFSAPAGAGPDSGLLAASLATKHQGA